MCDFGKEHHEEHFCVIILNVGHWSRRCGSKIFLSLALVVNSVEWNHLCNF